MAKEFVRVLPDEVAERMAQGWEPVGVSYFADGQKSVLMARSVAVDVRTVVARPDEGTGAGDMGIPRVDALLEPTFIGAHIAEPRVIAMTWAMLDPADFIDARHREIWCVLHQLRHGGGGDLHDVAERLPKLADYAHGLCRRFITDDAHPSVLLTMAAKIRTAAAERRELAARRAA